MCHPVAIHQCAHAPHGARGVIAIAEETRCSGARTARCISVRQSQRRSSPNGRFRPRRSLRRTESCNIMRQYVSPSPECGGCITPAENREQSRSEFRGEGKSAQEASQSWLRGVLNFRISSPTAFAPLHVSRQTSSHAFHSTRRNFIFP